MAVVETFQIMIPAGTKVAALRNSKGGVVSDVIAVKGDCYIDNATRHEDGSYGYSIDKVCYVASAGTIRVLKIITPGWDVDGWFAANRPAR